MTGYRAQVVDVIRAQGLRVLDSPVRLASGAMSRYFVDGKRALRQGRDLIAAGHAMLTVTREMGVEFSAVGGLTNGADHLAHVVAVLSDTEWFFVRKQAKDRGTRQRVEGAVLGPGVRVLLVDDVVTTGASIVEALDEVEGAGATPVAALALVDRDSKAAGVLAARGVPYAAVLTFRDLGIPPVSGEGSPQEETATG